MPLITVRRTIWAAVLAVFAAVLLAAALPLIASTQIVRNRITQEMGSWSGYRVTIEQDPEIRLFPLRAILTDMKLSDWKGEGPPVLSAERTTVDLEAFPGLIGDVYIWRVRLQSPVLRVERDANGIYLPRLPGGGRMANAVKDAQVITATNPSNPDFSSMAGDPFGVVKFTDGRIIDEDGAGIVSNCEGIVSWPSLEKPGSLRATGVWRGETVNVELSSNEPMMLLTGGTGQARFSFSGAPGNATFEGKVNLSSKPFIAAQVQRCSSIVIDEVHAG
ncbi:MAG: AsmA family protein, partial [Rhizobiales bacterium]|nr:AsmA family protein [Hyphomicrobiales bacterium]